MFRFAMGLFLLSVSSSPALCQNMGEELLAKRQVENVDITTTEVLALPQEERVAYILNHLAKSAVSATKDYDILPTPSAALTLVSVNFPKTLDWGMCRQDRLILTYKFSDAAGDGSRDTPVRFHSVAVQSRHADPGQNPDPKKCGNIADEGYFTSNMPVVAMEMIRLLRARIDKNEVPFEGCRDGERVPPPPIKECNGELRWLKSVTTFRHAQGTLNGPIATIILYVSDTRQVELVGDWRGKNLTNVVVVKTLPPPVP